MSEAAAEPVPAQQAKRVGRPPQHQLTKLRAGLRTLTTRRLDGRSAAAVAVREWKAAVTNDLGELSRARQTILEGAAQKLLIRDALGQWLLSQPTLVTKKRAVVAVLKDYLAVSDSLARDLERLGLDRKAAPIDDVGSYIAA